MCNTKLIFGKGTIWFPVGEFGGSVHRARFNDQDGRWELWHKTIYANGETDPREPWEEYENGPTDDCTFPSVECLMAYVMFCKYVRHVTVVSFKYVFLNTQTLFSKLVPQ